MFLGNNQFQPPVSCSVKGQILRHENVARLVHENGSVCLDSVEDSFFQTWKFIGDIEWCVLPCRNITCHSYYTLYRADTRTQIVELLRNVNLLRCLVWSGPREGDCQDTMVHRSLDILVLRRPCQHIRHWGQKKVHTLTPCGRCKVLEYLP